MRVKKLLKIIYKRYKKYLYYNKIYCDINSKDFYNKRIKRIDS